MRVKIGIHLGVYFTQRSKLLCPISSVGRAVGECLMSVRVALDDELD